jgi:hypothetical protein
MATSPGGKWAGIINMKFTRIYQCDTTWITADRSEKYYQVYKRSRYLGNRRYVMVKKRYSFSGLAKMRIH